MRVRLQRGEEEEEEEEEEKADSPNELMPQMQPCTKILCSYMTMSEPVMHEREREKRGRGEDWSDGKKGSER